jgi:hypothetical protein
MNKVLNILSRPAQPLGELGQCLGPPKFKAPQKNLIRSNFKIKNKKIIIIKNKKTNVRPNKNLIRPKKKFHQNLRSLTIINK